MATPEDVCFMVPELISSKSAPNDEFYVNCITDDEDKLLSFVGFMYKGDAALKSLYQSLEHKDLPRKRHKIMNYRITRDRHLFKHFLILIFQLEKDDKYPRTSELTISPTEAIRIVENNLKLGIKPKVTG